MFVEYKQNHAAKNKKNDLRFMNDLFTRYMFVEYESHRAAALARKKLVQGSVFLFGHEIGQVRPKLMNRMNESIKLHALKIE